RFEPNPPLVSNSARSRASARLSATVVFVRRPRSSKSERSRLVVDRPASAAATSRSSPASRSERLTSFPITSSFTNREAACLTNLSGLYSADPTIRNEQIIFRRIPPRTCQLANEILRFYTDDHINTVEGGEMATLVRWEPFREIASLQNEMSRFMNGLLEGNGRTNQAWVPALDVWETESEIVYALDLPGVPE